jgi:beta-galactosidase
MGKSGLRTAIALGSLALASVSSQLAIARNALAEPVQSAPRQTQDLTANWRFHYGDDVAGVTAATFDDSAWQTVSLPHTWNRIGQYGLARTAANENRQGVGYYRLTFRGPQLDAGRRHYLQFDGVGNVAEVWVNGIRVGEHKGAFSRFRFDVTSMLKPGADNVLVVKADNSKPAPGSSRQDVIPLGGDFFIHGGIYRGVSLISTSAASIDLLDHGGPGIYARATQVSADVATVAVQVRLRNSASRTRNLIARTEITDAAGTVVASGQAATKLGAGAGEVAQTLTLPHPHLWNGRADPYMYRVTVRLFDGRKELDAVSQPLGIRTFRIDKDQGFFLNGAHIALFGASRHQDKLGKGWALSPEDHAEDMALMAEMGANTVRMAHYQHAQEWDDAADKTGMVAWAEIPFVNAVSFEDGAKASPALEANAREQLTELIRQNYNHPSIMMWSVGNEVDIGASFGRGKKPSRSIELLRDLSALAHQEDPSRPTTFADCCEEADAFANNTNPVLNGSADLIGYNRYYGWYYGKPQDFAARLDHFHAKHPDVPMSVSEYGAGGGITQHSDNPLGGPINAFGRPHPEEYESYYHEVSFKSLKERPYLFATWVWNMFDFASDLRAEGDAVDLNDKGLVTYDRKTRKDAFYFYKANLNPEPMIHLTSRRYIDRAYPAVDVRAYASAASASLTVNGVSIGSTACPDHICVWPGVALKPGDNTLVASAGGVTDTLHWNGPDVVAHGLHLDAGNLAGHLAPDGLRYGSDTFFTGGQGRVLNVSGFGADRDKGRKAVTGGSDASLFNYYREGAFAYNLPVPDGTWRVTVTTFEPDSAQVATRSFAVLADGKRIAGEIKPGQLAGGALKAVTQSFPVKVAGGHLKLDFQPLGGPAIVAAIDLTKAP